MNCVTYGCGEFNPDKFFRPQNREDFNKPRGGLWSSPVGCEWGWKDWCLREDFGDLSHSFTFEFKGKVLKIDSLRDLENAHDKYTLNDRYVDWEKVSEDFDGVWLTARGERDTYFSRPLSLYGWDCETLFVCNKNSVKVLEVCDVQ